VPAESFTHAAVTTASAVEVQAALERAETWQGIGPIDAVWDASHSKNQLTRFRWSARAAGKSWEGTATRLEGPDVAFDLAASEVEGRIQVATEQQLAGTRLSVTLEARSRGILAGMFWGVIADALRQGFSSQVEEFAAGLSD
jgi:hypothetical protein